MFIDARSMPSGTLLEAPVCIIGGGPAGIVIATELDRAGISSWLLEAGGLDFSSSAQSLYRGEVEGLSYSLTLTRTCQFGGSSNCWGGWCRPMSRMDLERRSWVPNSGWPFGEETLNPYLHRASKTLELGEWDEDRVSWANHAGALGAPLLPFEGSDLENIVDRLSPPTRFGAVYGPDLVHSRLTRVLLHAGATELLTTDDGRRITQVAVRGGDTVTLKVKAGLVILAAGGIENARLLLNSRRTFPAGLGNGHDLVGRYFMDHPRVRLGRLHLNAGRSHSRFYDVTYYYGNRALERNGARGSVSAGLTERAQRSQQLVQCHVGLVGSYFGEGRNSVEAGKRLYRAVTRRNHEPLTRAAMVQAMCGLPLSAVAWAARMSRSRRLIHHFDLQTVIEPVPDPASRLLLTAERDHLGLNRIKLRWRIGDLEKRSHRAAVLAFRNVVESVGLGRVDVAEEDWGEGWHDHVMSTWHHMGTTRMDEDPRRGVVDKNCRVHGIDNLYVAGSSVFPTGGGCAPTMTIVALAYRLADRVVELTAARSLAV